MANALEQIRDVERAVARRIGAAEERAEASIAEAGREADRLLDQGSQEGLESARRTHTDAVAAAQEEAGRIVGDGQVAAEELVRVTRPELDAVVDAMVDLVLAPPAEAGV